MKRFDYITVFTAAHRQLNCSTHLLRVKLGLRIKRVNEDSHIFPIVRKSHRKQRRFMRIAYEESIRSGYLWRRANVRIQRLLVATGVSLDARWIVQEGLFLGFVDRKDD